jgi:aldehyde dehydrogenase (NAD+)
MSKKSHKNAKSAEELSLDFTSKLAFAPAPESSSHSRLQKQYELFINGTWVKPEKGGYFETVNPSTEQVIARIAEATQEDVDKAVIAARNAYENVWGKMPAKERAKYIFALRD